MLQISEILCTEEMIKTRVRQLGEQISKDYEGKTLYVIGILKGAAIFMADLVREIQIPVKIDYMSVSSYGNATHSSGAVRTYRDLDMDINGQHVLVVEDIVDTGLTMDFLKNSLYLRHPASLKVCAFLDKPAKRKIHLEIEYTGYTYSGEDFLVGYGLDAAEEGRNLPYIGTFK